VIYTFKCSKGHRTEVSRSIAEGPPSDGFRCSHAVCGRKVRRDWQNDAPMLDTSACKDHSYVPPEKRVASRWDRGTPDRVEQQFKQHVEGRRREIRDAGGQRGNLKQTHAVPAHLYHGKIRETGDKNYWSDPKNLAKHTECKVE
jgi:hypothetical protein